MARNDFGIDAAICQAQCADTHAFIANTDAAIAKNAARPIVEHNRGPLLFRHVLLHFGKAAFARAVLEHHVLQFALAALVANGTIQRMVREQEFQSGFARLHNGFRFRLNHHAFSHRQRARRLQFGKLFHFDETHAASGLQRHALVVAKRRNFRRHRLTGFD